MTSDDFTDAAQIAREGITLSEGYRWVTEPTVESPSPTIARIVSPAATGSAVEQVITIITAPAHDSVTLELALRGPDGAEALGSVTFRGRFRSDSIATIRALLDSR